MPHRIERFVAPKSDRIVHVDHVTGDVWLTSLVRGPEAEKLEEEARSSWTGLPVRGEPQEDVLPSVDTEEPEEEDDVPDLDTALHQLREQSAALRSVAKAVKGCEGADGAILRLMRDRAHAMVALVWSIEGTDVADAMPKWDNVAHGADFGGLLYVAPVVAIATDALVDDPHPSPGSKLSPRWYWCAEAVDEIGYRIEEWLEEHASAEEASP